MSIYDQSSQPLHQIKSFEEKLNEQQKINENLKNEIESVKAEYERKTNEMKAEADERYNKILLKFEEFIKILDFHALELHDAVLAHHQIYHQAQQS